MEKEFNENDEDFESIYWKRFVWFDQLRGVIIFIFIVALVMFPLSGDLLTGEVPVGGVIWNHGWRYSQLSYDALRYDFPPMITLIDLGQGSIVFCVGFMQSISFLKRAKYMNLKNAWTHVFYRVLFLFGLSILVEDIILGFGWFYAFFDGTIANLAWASLIAPLVTYLFKNADKRAIVGIIILLLHFSLYFVEDLRLWSTGTGRTYYEFPWRALNLSAISIFGSAYAKWWFTDDGQVQTENFKTRIIPVTIAFFLINYLLEFFQWSDQERCTTALASLIIGFMGIMLLLFYSFEAYEFRFPKLEAVGKNMLFFFFISPVIAIVTDFFFRDLIYANKIFAFIFAGVLPIGLIFLIAYVLEKKKIYFKI